MVDVIIRYWVGILVENEDGPDGFGYTVVDKMKLFYAYCGLIDSTILVWLKWVFDILIGLFEQFGIINNTENMVIMVCHPGPMTMQQSSEIYGWRMNREGYPNHVNQCQKLVWGVVDRILTWHILPPNSRYSTYVKDRPGHYRIHCLSLRKINTGWPYRR